MSIGRWIVGLVLVSASCSSIDPEATVDVACPSYDDFAPVSSVLEQRCGTLDCHGSLVRPLKIYGETGLRRRQELDASADVISDFSEYYPGGKEPTTDLERLDNYRAVCGLEPELMTRVVQGASAPEELMLLKKPRLIEKHKGGKIFTANREGDLCIVNFLRAGASGQFDTEPCEQELSHP